MSNKSIFEKSHPSIRAFWLWCQEFGKNPNSVDVILEHRAIEARHG